MWTLPDVWYITTKESNDCGKYKGRLVEEVLKNDADIVPFWIMNGDSL